MLRAIIASAFRKMRLLQRNIPENLNSDEVNVSDPSVAVKRTEQQR